MSGVCVVVECVCVGGEIIHHYMSSERQRDRSDLKVQQGYLFLAFTFEFIRNYFDINDW